VLDDWSPYPARSRDSRTRVGDKNGGNDTGN